MIFHREYSKLPSRYANVTRQVYADWTGRKTFQTKRIVLQVVPTREGTVDNNTDALETDK